MVNNEKPTVNYW